jgi:hypothetical protein
MFLLDVKTHLNVEPKISNEIEDIINPKLTIGTLDFQYISSPTNFFVLEPTKKFKDLVQDDDICIHILIGDTHNSAGGQCEEIVDTSITVINTSSTGWFKILDSISSDQQPIDYFVENYFPFKLLQDPDLILSKDTIQQLKKTETSSFLTFIRDNYLPCFSSINELKQKHCFTKNIRYHMVDIRTTSDTLNINLTTQQSVKNPIFFERYFYQTFVNFFRSLNSNEIICVNAQNSIKVEDFILIMLQNKLSECSDILFDENNLFFTKKSLIFKQISKQKGSRIFFINFCKEYWKYAIETLFDLHEFESEKKKLIELFHHRKQLCDNTYTDFGTANSTQKEYINYAYRFNKTIRIFLHITMFPFLDLYYMLRSWKQVPIRSWCSVLNAGSMHAFLIANFLSLKGYFQVRFAEGNLYEIKASKYDIIRMFDSRIKERCLQVSTSVNIDTLSSNAHIDYELINARKKFLGGQLYLKMMNGYQLTREELEVLCKQQKQDIHEVEKLFKF